MQIIKDPNNPEVREGGGREHSAMKQPMEMSVTLTVFIWSSSGLHLVFILSSFCLQALDSDQGSNESDTEQRNKALRGRM